MEEAVLELSAPAAMIGGMSSVQPPRGPLVGRAGELMRLAELVGLDGGESSTGVLLSGDAGVGKTRLLAAVRDRAESATWRVLVGHCLDLGNSAPPYLPFSEALGRFAAQEPVVADALAASRPAVGRLLPGAPRQRPGEGPVEAWTTDRSDLFESVHAALEQLARSAPVLLLIEDVHWADRSTREMLSFLFTRSLAADVTVVATYRSDDLHRRHPLRAVVAEWARLPAVSRLHLDPLEPRDIRVLVQALQPTPLPEQRVRDIIARSEGNAFFTEELVAAADRGDRALPVDLADLLLVRLDQLDEQARQVVRAAAVAGRQVSHRLLERVVGIDSTALDRGLRAAVDGNVLVAVGANGYAFRHALLTEAIYDDLLPGEKVRLHRAYSTALGSTAEGPAAELARHARAAHDMVTAARSSVRAGDEAMALGGPDEAARHYETALELLADPATKSEVAGRGEDRVDPVALAVRASGALSAAGHVLRAVALVQDQLHQLPADAEPRQRAELLRALAGAAAFADVGLDVLQLTQEALSLVPAEPPTRLRAQLVSAYAWANADRHRDEDASRWLAEAHQLAETLGLPDIATDASTTMARIQDRAGDPESSRLLLERTIETARAAGEFAGEIRGLYNLAGLAYESGRLCEAYDIYRRTAARAAEHGRPWAPYGIDARAMAALVAYALGKWDEAVEIVDVSGQSPPGMAEAVLAAVRLIVAAGRGDDLMLPLVADIRPWWERDGMITVLTAGAAIDLYGDRGDIEVALATHDDAVAQVTEMWQRPWFEARIRLSGLLIGQLAGQVATTPSQQRADVVRRAQALAEAAAQAVDAVLPRRASLGLESRAWQARVVAEHARLRWLAGDDAPDPEELVAVWRESVDVFDELGHVFEAARSRARLAAVLQAVGDSGGAAAQVALAREVGERLGAAPLLRELRLLGPHAPSRERLPRDLVLTAREHEVLELVAAGRSNKEIAQRLYISAKTVSVHVSNILAKLGASGRTEAAALARASGLLEREHR